MQYAIKLHTGELIIDPSWISLASFMKGMHGWCDTQASELGVPMVMINDEWVELDA